jgi:hypothetical protein
MKGSNGRGGLSALNKKPQRSCLECLCGSPRLGTTTDSMQLDLWQLYAIPKQIARQFVSY